MKDLLFKIPSSKRKTFAKHFLSGVNSEIAFIDGSIASLESNRASIIKLMEGLGFPENKQLTEGKISFEVGENNKAPAKIDQETNTIGHSFYCKASGFECAIHADKILLSTSSYKGFDDYSATLADILNGVNGILGDRDVVKVGLRKVNSIIVENVELYEEACSIFNPAIFSLLRSGLPSSAVKVSEEVILLQDGDATSILRNSFRELEAANTYEASLDFDIVNKKRSISKDAISITLVELNNIHFDLFSWAITDKMIEIMEQGD